MPARWTSSRTRSRLRTTTIRSTDPASRLMASTEWVLWLGLTEAQARDVVADAPGARAFVAGELQAMLEQRHLKGERDADPSRGSPRRRRADVQRRRLGAQSQRAADRR